MTEDPGTRHEGHGAEMKIQAFPWELETHVSKGSDTARRVGQREAGVSNHPGEEAVMGTPRPQSPLPHGQVSK